MAKQIPLTDGKFTLVNDTDYEWLNQWKWYARKIRNTIYAIRNSPRGKIKRPSIFMHRQILNLIIGDGKKVDHVDRNGLNNQRFNLRVCTPQQNTFNRKSYGGKYSGFKGITWNKRTCKWRATICINGKRQHLGTFGSAIEAARAYDDAAKKHFGEFAYLNFKDSAVLPIILRGGEK